MNWGVKRCAVPLLALLMSCAQGEVAVRTAPERRFAPRVDHHLPLLSPAGADTKLAATPLAKRPREGVKEFE